MPAFNVQKSPDVQEEDARTIGDWAENQFETLIADLQKQEVLDLIESFTAPLRPQTGNVAYADGVKWNPGGLGEGLYYYDSAGVWQLITNSVVLAAAISGAITPALTAYMKLAGNQTVTGGFLLTPFNAGTKSSGTFTPDATNANYQYYTNGGAHTLAAPANDCAIDILVTNNASAGAITFSGFTVNSNIGEALTTTNGHKFIISIRRINGTSTYLIKALQ